jgi:hypothetical protein
MNKLLYLYIINKANHFKTYKKMNLQVIKTPNKVAGTIILNGYSMKKDCIFKKYVKGCHKSVEPTENVLLNAGTVVNIIISKTAGLNYASLVSKIGTTTYQHILNKNEANILVEKYYNKFIVG